MKQGGEIGKILKREDWEEMLMKLRLTLTQLSTPRVYSKMVHVNTKKGLGKNGGTVREGRQHLGITWKREETKRRDRKQVSITTEEGRN